MLIAAAGVWIGLRNLDPDEMPKVGMLAAVFFVASFLHVPVGFSSDGLAGLLLGWGHFRAGIAECRVSASRFRTHP